MTIAAILINRTMPIFADSIDVPSTLDAIPAAPTTPDNSLELSLTEAYDLALRRNLNLYISRYDLALADTNILARWSGIFDPNFTLDHTILSEGITTRSYQSIFSQILQLIN